LLNGTIKRSSDLSRRLNLRVLGSVPYIETMRERRRSKIMAWVVTLVLLAGLVFGLLAVHFFYSPLDIVSLRAVAFLKSLMNR
jgi:Tfp pilus assembly protein PilN